MADDDACSSPPLWEIRCARASMSESFLVSTSAVVKSDKMLSCNYVACICHD